MPHIEVRNVSFSYGGRQALKNVTFSVEKGQIFGLLGPNGGGKTTLFRILCTLLVPDTGSVRIAGHDPVVRPLEVRRRIGVVFQSNSLDLQLTSSENLFHQGRLYGLTGRPLRRRVESLLERFGLEDRRRDLVKTLSGGLRRRLELAKGLLHAPEILILDEPTAGVDPGVRHDFWSYLSRLRRQDGMTILATTHLMEEAERCDRLMILNQGRLVAAGTPEALKSKVGGDVIVVRAPDLEALRLEIQNRFHCDPVIFNGTLRLEHRRGHRFLAELLESFPRQIETVTLGKPTLEDVFIHETGHRF
ncbi:MAG: ATP-binding cassette domain-containing protein [Acidobacteriota bacterium]